ncbi:hypothetical protein BH09PSE1_BH09PSE1_10070 [soil metagenome]
MDEPPLTAAQCRDRARNCFRRAVAEENLTAREEHLKEGETWMMRWRIWAPDSAADTENKSSAA